MSLTSPEDQLAALIAIIHGEDWLMRALQEMRSMALDDGWIVAGAIYNSVWNRLTGRPGGYGVKDIDLFYFDGDDLSYEAEDRVIRRGAVAFNDISIPVEIRNQARVHLWFGKHFGFEIPPIRDCRDSIGRFASICYCVGARLDDAGRIEVFAPHGLDDLFAMQVRPNRFCDNRATHDQKAARAKALWPELTVVEW